MSADQADHNPLRPEAADTHYEGTGAVKIPGMGRPPNRCRDYDPVGVCLDGHLVLGKSSCGTRYCPDHWRDWCEAAVINMVARLAAYREAQPMGAERRLSHVVASPPQDRTYSERAMWETRRDAYDALEAAGVRGGAVITHPYRTTERADHLYATVKQDGDLPDGTGKWRWLRNTTEDWGDLSQYIEASPHYHCLAAAEDIDGSAAPEGWIVERIRTFQGFHYRDLEAYRDMVAAAYYVLSHGAVSRPRATTTYWGSLAPASFNPEEALTAARWDTIQRMAERAVRGPERVVPVEEEDEEECPHAGCEAPVRSLWELPDLMDDDDWRAGLDADRLKVLRGALVWYEGRADRPPPSVKTCKPRLREWLHDLGDTHTPSPTQAQLPTEVFGVGQRGTDYAD